MDNQKNLLFGKTALIEAINNHLKIEKVITKKNILESKPIFKDLHFEYVDNKYFEQYKQVNHQYIITVLKQEINYLNLDTCINKYANEQTVTFLMLDENEDPRNFGAIIRSAAAFGVNAIIYKNNHQAQINDLVIKTSMGAVYYLDFIKVANLNQTIEKLKQANYWIYASSLSDQSINLNDTKFDKRSVIILGNEHHGISALTLKKADFIFKIPMYNNNIQSLNISVAAGIILNKRFNDL